GFSSACSGFARSCSFSYISSAADAMDPAAEVARIKAEAAARKAAWLAAIRARLAQGPATSRQLAEACGCRSSNGSFGMLLVTLKHAGRLVVVGTTIGAKGSAIPLLEWAGDD